MQFSENYAKFVVNIGSRTDSRSLGCHDPFRLAVQHVETSNLCRGSPLLEEFGLVRSGRCERLGFWRRTLIEALSPSLSPQASLALATTLSWGCGFVFCLLSEIAKNVPVCRGQTELELPPPPRSSASVERLLIRRSTCLLSF